MAGVIDWHGEVPPPVADLHGRRVLAQGLTGVEVFKVGGAVVLGNTTDTVPTEGLTSAFRDFSVGTRTQTWGWKALARRVEQEFAERLIGGLSG